MDAQKSRYYRQLTRAGRRAYAAYITFRVTTPPPLQYCLLGCIILSLLLLSGHLLEMNQGVSKGSSSSYQNPPPIKSSPVPEQYLEVMNKGLPLHPPAHASNLHLGTVNGHNLTQFFNLPMTSSYNDIKESSVTVLLYIHSTRDLRPQMYALQQQSIKPKEIWIISSVEDEKTTRSWKKDGVRVVAVDETLGGSNGWLSLVARTTTDYILLVSNGVVLGQKYLEMLLRAGNTEEYEDALLGTMGVDLLGKEAECFHGRWEDEEVKPETRSVDMLEGAWLIKRDWAPILTKDIRLSHNVPLGYYISHSFRYQAAIPSILIPTGPTDKAFWADTRSESVLRAACNKLQDAYMTNSAWRKYIASLGDHLVSREVANTDANIVFVIDGARQARIFPKVFCALTDRAKIHVIVTGSSRGISYGRLNKHLEGSYSQCKGVRIYDINVESSSSVGHNTANVLAQVAHSIERLLEIIRPRILFHATHLTNPAIKGIEIAAKITQTLTISMPIDDFKHINWIGDVELSALERWHDARVQLIVITNNRPHSLSRLIRSLTIAHYLGDNLPLTINMEQSVDRVTRLYMNSLNWPHGEKFLRHRIKKGGLMPQIIESWYPSNDNDYAVLLEDDIEVSPYYYSWLKYNILKYRYTPSNQKPALRMFGISLYGQRATELKPEGRRPFLPDEELANTDYPARIPYLLQVPCSWGALYFPEHWREYHEYLMNRLLDLGSFDMQNLTVPNSRSNRWKASWKKFFIEYIYLRGYVMLYPNYYDYTSFSTNHLEFGSHVTKDDGRSQRVMDQFMVPLMQEDEITRGLPNERLPAFEDLPVLDIHGKLSDFDELVARGNLLRNHISACVPLPEESWEPFNPFDLLCPYPPSVDKKKDRSKKSRPLSPSDIPIDNADDILDSINPDNGANVDADVINEDGEEQEPEQEPEPEPEPDTDDDLELSRDDGPSNVEDED